MSEKLEYLIDILIEAAKDKGEEYARGEYSNITYLLDKDRDALVEYVTGLESENARLRDAARWIPVEERLPEPLIPVDVVMDGMVTNLMLSPDKETWMNVAGWPYSASSITHWRALPEPPEVK